MTAATARRLSLPSEIPKPACVDADVVSVVGWASDAGLSEELSDREDSARLASTAKRVSTSYRHEPYLTAPVVRRQQTPAAVSSRPFKTVEEPPAPKQVATTHGPAPAAAAPKPQDVPQMQANRSEERYPDDLAARDVTVGERPALASPFNPQCPCPDCVAYYHHCDPAEPPVPEFEYDSYYGVDAMQYAEPEPEYGRWGSLTPPSLATQVPAVPPPPYCPPAPEVQELETKSSWPADDAEKTQPPSAKAPSTSVMCCYHKQGRCKMGDDCWYSHDGENITPCHYGALCKAGHRHLVKSGSSAAVPTSRPARQQGQQSKTRRGHGGSAPRRSAETRPSVMPCAYCGGDDCVRTQEYPVFVGSEMVMGLRAHCSRCLRTYAL